MKHLFTLILLVIVVQISFAQTINTKTENRLAIEMNFYVPFGSAPSLNGGLDRVGGLYYNTSDGLLYTYGYNSLWEYILNKRKADQLYVSLTGAYADPAWLTALNFSKITGRPTSLSGYGITDALLHQEGNETKNGVLTFTSSPFIPDGVNANHAVNRGQLDLKLNLSDYVSTTLSGDIAGTGKGSITTTLATVNNNVGTFNNVMVNAKGLVTSASNIIYQSPQTTLSGYGITDAAINADVVHLAGTESISGSKTFNQPVLIGDNSNPGSIKLTVNGKIKTRAINVDPGNWPDYVFSASYDLPKLTDIEKFILKNKHLPGVPSAKEIAQTGVNLGEINEVLLRKIEELTIYLIELKKENESIKEEVKAIKARLK